MTQPVVNYVFDSIVGGEPQPNLRSLPGVERCKLLDYFDVCRVPYALVPTSAVATIAEPTMLVYPVYIERIDFAIDYVERVPDIIHDQVATGRAKIAFFISSVLDSDECADLLEVALHSIEQYPYLAGNLKIFVPNAKMFDIGPFIYWCPEELEVWYAAQELDKQSKQAWPATVDYAPRKYMLSAEFNGDTVQERLVASTLWQHGAYNNSIIKYNHCDLAKQYYNTSISDWEEAFSENDVVIAQYMCNFPLLTTPTANSYTDAYWRVIVDEHFFDDSEHLPYSIFESMLHLQPFIYAGPAHSLEILDMLGYKTLHGYIDESGDDVADDESRMACALSEVFDRLHSPHSDHVSMLAAIAPILEHNQQHLLADKTPRLLEITELMLDNVYDGEDMD